MHVGWAHAITTLVASFEAELVWVEALIRREPAGFSLRHERDRATPDGALRSLPLEALREWAQVTATGAFRPNKAAPSLRQGWVTHVADAAELETALRGLYPGSLADWLEARRAAPGVTHFREFVGRQSGLYRAARELTDGAAAEVIRAGCAPEFCRRQRLWTVDGLAPEVAGAKSCVPCLEPCALVLELARRAGQLAAEQGAELPSSRPELEALLRAVEAELAQPATDVREGELDDPRNPRRLAWQRERLRTALAALPPA
jgi:hypothetical protein